MSENNALQPQGPNNGLAMDIFREVDFTGLNTVIENLGNHNGELSDTEKGLAMGIVGEWQGSIIKRLHEKAGEMNRFLNFFEVNSCSDPLFEEVGEEISQKTNTVNEFKAVLEARKELGKIQNDRPQQPIHGLETTTEEELVSTADYKLAMAKYNVVEEKAKRVLRKRELEWKTLLKENAEVKELITKAHKYNRNLKGFTAECEDKGQLAKVNISIASQEVRNSLKELIEFGAKNI